MHILPFLQYTQAICVVGFKIAGAEYMSILL